MLDSSHLKEIDWFGESPVEMQDSLPSHFLEWRNNCDIEGCDKDSQVYYVEGAQYLCFDHAEDVYT